MVYASLVGFFVGQNDLLPTLEIAEMRVSHVPRALITILFVGSTGCSLPSQGETTLLDENSTVAFLMFDFETPLEEGRIETVGLEATQTASNGNGVLRVQSYPETAVPRLILKPLGEHWNLSPYEYLEVSVFNRGIEDLDLICQVENPDRGAFSNFNSREFTIPAGERMNLRVTFIRVFSAGDKMFGMKGFPGRLVERNGLRPEIVTQLHFTIGNSGVSHDFELAQVLAGGTYSFPAWMFKTKEEYFPCIDRYGQFIFADWPGKIGSDEDLKTQLRREEEDLRKHQGPEVWNQYGGWKEGPSFEKRPGFYTKKYQGKWWLVDPAGNLFWSHGINCVRSNNGTTPISDREHWFQGLPAENEFLFRFIQESDNARRGYYAGKKFRTYDFSRANLYRKYGEGWQRRYVDLAHTRLRSWGLNTVGNWSEQGIYLEDRTPYVTNIAFRRKTLEGGPHFPDPFDPGFQPSLIERLKQERGKTAEDPWCIGYFVDNELRWMTNISLACYTLQSPANQPAKLVFVEDLKAKYSNIIQLNNSWATQYLSWKNLAESESLPDLDGGCKTDLLEFSKKTAETYFRKVSEAVKKITPERLYLGCRFGQFAAAETAVLAAAKYCDVVSFNLYKPWNRSAMRTSLPDGLDRPVVIGEFHFGALDRGPLSTGLAAVENQDERAESYNRYIRRALENPLVIGTSWFQYSDQATTGRSDGENYQIGFVDICDTPYIETIEAARQVGYELYSYRMSKRR